MPLINVRLLTKIFIQNDRGEVLLIRRSATDSHRPSGWDIPGGHTDTGEDPNVTVLRELSEETGLSCRDCNILCVASENDSHHVVTLFYRGHADSGAVTLSPEHTGYRWVDPRDLPNFDMPEKYARAAKLLSPARQPV